MERSSASVRTRDFRFTPISFDRSSKRSLQFQLYEEFRKAILSGRFQGGMRLPSTRTLAADLGVSRNTVVNAFEQLMSEGYVAGKIGSGTYVANATPDNMLVMPGQSSVFRQVSRSRRTISNRGRRIAALKSSFPVPTPIPFRHGFPSLEQFPIKTWVQIAGRRLRHIDRELLNYGHPAGYWPLRKAISSYLAISRSIHCEPEQVIVHAGSQTALYLTAQMLLDPGDVAWIEDPGYLGARGALAAAGAKLVPVPVDEQGMSVHSAIQRNSTPRLIYVTPSNQYPLTVTMSLSRRLELLQYANRAGAWIVEDDYDSEFRYESRPVAALQGLDQRNQVIYICTFSKLLAPTLRLGFLVVPPILVDTFTSALALISRSAPAIEQVVLADFIEEGHLARHIRRMRMLYMERQAHFCEVARHHLAGRIEVKSSNAGTHLIGWLPQGEGDNSASQAAAQHGVVAMPLSNYYLGTPRRGALVFGYAAFDKPEISAGIRNLAVALGARAANSTTGV